MAKLERLIEKHRASLAAFHEAIDREQEAEAAWEAMRVERPLVPNLLLGGKMELLDGHDIEETLRQDYSRTLAALKRRMQRAAPDLAKQNRNYYEQTPTLDPVSVSLGPDWYRVSSLINLGP